MKNNKKYKIIDIFSGCGGLSTGFEQTQKFKTCLAIDVWQEALNTIKKNKPTIDTFTQDLSNFKDEDILKIKKNIKM